jgi:hypothetical protein
MGDRGNSRRACENRSHRHKAVTTINPGGDTMTIERENILPTLVTLMLSIAMVWAFFRVI